MSNAGNAEINQIAQSRNEVLMATYTARDNATHYTPFRALLSIGQRRKSVHGTFSRVQRRPRRSWINIPGLFGTDR
jgi:hypothetical protein